MRIYVGNLSYSTSEEGLRAAFGEFGAVDTVDIIEDRNTGRSKGFGFIEMPSKDEAEKAITEMNGKEFMGRALKVNIAKPKTDRRGGGGGGRGRGRGFQSRGGGRRY